MKTLLLMRHAKSDWDAAYGADRDRPLSKRGERSARLMGRLLQGMGLAPDHIISSPAVRARATAQLAAQAGAWGCPIALAPDLYGAGPETVVSVAAQAPDVQRLMLVGHQPTWSTALLRLTGARADMKTASVAVIETTARDWADLPDVSGALAALHHPRPFFGSEWDDGPGGR